MEKIQESKESRLEESSDKDEDLNFDSDDSEW